MSHAPTFEVILRSGRRETASGDAFDWRHCGGETDIIAYRLLPPEETAKDGEGVEAAQFQAPAQAQSERFPFGVYFTMKDGGFGRSSYETLAEADEHFNRLSNEPAVKSAALKEFYADENVWAICVSYEAFPDLAKPADGPSSQELQHEQTPSETNNQQEDSLKGEWDGWKPYPEARDLPLERNGCWLEERFDHEAYRWMYRYRPADASTADPAKPAPVSSDDASPVELQGEQPNPEPVGETV